MNGLSTNQGTNALIPILIAFEIGQSFDPETQKWFYPVCLTAMCVVLYLTKGSTIGPADGADLIEDKEDLKEVLKRGRK